MHIYTEVNSELVKLSVKKRLSLWLSCKEACVGGWPVFPSTSRTSCTMSLVPKILAKSSQEIEGCYKKRETDKPGVLMHISFPPAVLF